jgi:hypothetical protein
MKNLAVGLSAAVLTLGIASWPGLAQGAPAAPVKTGTTSHTRSESGFDVLPGRWIRSDGGYVIIKIVGSEVGQQHYRCSTFRHKVKQR